MLLCLLLRMKVLCPDCPGTMSPVFSKNVQVSVQKRKVFQIIQKIIQRNHGEEEMQNLVEVKNGKFYHFVTISGKVTS